MVQQVEWLNQNAGRAYPIQEDMGRAPTSSGGGLLPGIQLPNYVLVDAVFTVPGDPSTRVYLAQLSYAGTVLSLVFRTVAGATLTALAVDLSSHKPNTPYSVSGIGDLQDCRGWVTIGDLSRLPADLPQGLYLFGAGQTLLEARTTRPAIRGVRSLRIQNGATVSPSLTGNVNLVAGPNISFQYRSDLNAILVSAIPNAGYREACPCQDNLAASLVQTINGIPLKDVTIVGDGECVQVTTSGNTITITDICSKPCCGCPELDFLNQTVDVINSSLTRLEQYSQQLNERITTFTSNYILTVGT